MTVALLSIAALVLSGVVYAICASSVRSDTSRPRKRKRWASGLGVVVIAPVLILISREPGVDLAMVGVLLVMLVICFVMFMASFIRSER